MCVFQNLDNSFIYLLVYINDMLIIAKYMYVINRLKEELHGKFEMKDFGAAKKILGMEIQRNKL